LQREQRTGRGQRVHTSRGTEGGGEWVCLGCGWVAWDGVERDGIGLGGTGRDESCVEERLGKMG
jgi:hypothetical protein